MRRASQLNNLTGELVTDLMGCSKSLPRAGQ